MICLPCNYENDASQIGQIVYKVNNSNNCQENDKKKHSNGLSYSLDLYLYFFYPQFKLLRVFDLTIQERKENYYIFHRNIESFVVKLILKYVKI